MINAKEVRKVCDKAKAGVLPFEVRYFGLIKNISDKIKLAAVSEYNEIKLSLVSIGLWSSGAKAAGLKEFLKENGYGVEVIPDGPYSDVEFVISW